MASTDQSLGDRSATRRRELHRNRSGCGGGRPTSFDRSSGPNGGGSWLVRRCVVGTTWEQRPGEGGNRRWPTRRGKGPCAGAFYLVAAPPHPLGRRSGARGRRFESCRARSARGASRPGGPGWVRFPTAPIVHRNRVPSTLARTRAASFGSRKSSERSARITRCASVSSSATQRRSALWSSRSRSTVILTRLGPAAGLDGGSASLVG
jgi:hypothetical protein